MSGRLQGKTVMVTGAGTGFGATLAEAVRAAGAEAALVQGDIAEWDQIKRMAEEAGDVDVLVNNVGDMASSQHSWPRPAGHHEVLREGAGPAGAREHVRPRVHGHARGDGHAGLPHLSRRLLPLRRRQRDRLRAGVRRRHADQGRPGVPGGRLARYRLDDGHDLSLVDRTVQRGRAHLSAALPAAGLELIVLRPA